MIKKIILYFILLLFLSFNAYSQTNKSIIVDGNQNIDNEVIFSIIDEDCEVHPAESVTVNE